MSQIERHLTMLDSTLTFARKGWNSGRELDFETDAIVPTIAIAACGEYYRHVERIEFERGSDALTDASLALLANFAQDTIAVHRCPIQLEVYDSDPDEPVFLYPMPPDTVVRFSTNLPKTFSFSRDGSMLVMSNVCLYPGPSECLEFGLEVVNTVSGELKTLSLAALETGAVAINPVTNEMAIGLSDGGIRVWDTSSNGLEQSIPAGHATAVFALGFSSNGKMLASGSCVESSSEWHEFGSRNCSSSEIRLWNVETGQSIGGPLLGLDGTVESIRFSPNGEILMANGSKHEFAAWDLGLDRLRGLACSRANRNLTTDEWSQFIGPAIPYRQTCPELSLP
jgi:WD40 repeat protein